MAALIVCVPIAVVVLVATDGGWRAAVISTFILAIISLSQVVVTGYAGQVSLAQLPIAGAAAFLLSVFSSDLSMPFPLAPVLAAVLATVLGVVVGLPALRIRGLAVAVVTLALAVALEAFWFRNPDLNGGVDGAPIANPELFGIDLGIGAGEGYPRLTFGFACLLILVVVAVGVAWLRRSRLGASMLAVRANERSAAAAGIDVRRVKLAAFAIAAFIAAVGGCLLGYQQNVASSSTYAALAGIGLFATAYLCGVTSVSGGILAGVAGAGGLMFLAMERWLHLGDYYAMFSGLMLVLVVIQNPEGIVGPLHEKIRIWRNRKSAPLPSELTAEAPPEMATLTRSEPGEEILHLNGIGVRYGAVVAVDDVTLAVREGEILGLIGPNGAGKTTFIDGISGYASADGTVSLNGESLDGLPPHRRSRAGLGRTFQGIELYEDLTVEENVVVGTTAAADRPTSEDLDQLYRLLGLGSVAKRPVAELSQGRRQLVSVARALAGRPRVVLLDEPAAGLDSDESLWLGERLQAMRDSGVTVVMIEHDMGLVLEICDKIAVLDLGRLIAFGTPDEIKGNPEVVRAYLGSTHNKVDPDDVDSSDDTMTKEPVS
ncbi:branched-chain amino acid ABC transporter ATP-binding protein/permease [Nocardioides panzhihuensis]|uniref:ABC-type branched-subunit amino acid transport system ATPase component/ABC-type branched-subunit amino acid transport system permease subunit n=1 Tax=Nocardioides panzhihuensis TaxID=860243 RepID=A0A7Z0DHM4_9ACTN|nr:ABC-type branched-subunit amino acid transport system ATPase component/ABC-type branched-subunit amino acid transport system permease subunit [Nocardioides panzhihuensis]